jgi:hypothetical protein
MQSLTQELDKLPLNLGLQGVWEGREQDAFLGGHDAVTTPKVVTSSVIESSVNLVGGSGASLKAETGIRIKISGVKKTTTVGSFPG